MNKIDAINAIRVLSVDEVQKANSGHPGFPLGAAPIIYALFADGMDHAPGDPEWFDRDRFVLSGGHGSAMLYATLHLFGYPKMDIQELKQFRQFGSLTPGHPEYGHTPGVEATTGPLGAGMGMAVGMAIAEAHLAKKFNKPDMKIVDHYTFALGGEGCFMEGISSEVFSLAGTLGLGKLIILFDSNEITIEGDTKLAFTEDLVGRMESFGFQTLTVADGNNPDAIAMAIAEAKADLDRPSFIKIRTKIGYGVPDREGTSKAHGEPVGEENVKILRENLSWQYDEPFFVPEDIYAHYRCLSESGLAKRDAWQTLFSAYAAHYPSDATLFNAYLLGQIKPTLFEGAYLEYEPKPDASRNISGRVLNELKDSIPWLVGGSADLAPSNKTEMKGAGDLSKETPDGRNIHFGVRELGMTAIGNGLILHGGLRAYVATFFVFSDYMKPMLRLSALMGLPLIAVLTHDSIGVGEDGPTHEPVEQLAMLRSTPNIQVFRPADEYETRIAWKQALLSVSAPSVLALTRQNLPVLAGSGPEAEKGAYVIAPESAAALDLILMASGSEVAPAIEAKEAIEAEGYSVRVVSVPCMEIFERQPEAYRMEVLPQTVKKRIAIEAGSSFSWGKLVGIEGEYVTMDRFGASAPPEKLFETFGIHKDVIVNTALAMLSK